jgi:hypothetical protein
MKVKSVSKKADWLFRDVPQGDVFRMDASGVLYLKCEPVPNATATWAGDPKHWNCVTLDGGCYESVAPTQPVTWYSIAEVDLGRPAT